MPFKVRKANQSDIPSLIDVYFDAFGDHPVTRRVFNSNPEHVRKFWLDALASGQQKPGEHFMVLTDPDSATPERIIAFCIWREVFTTTSPLPSPSPLPPVSWPEDADLGCVENFFGTVERMHKNIMGDRPHWYLDILGVREECRGKGAGTQLLRWGLVKADDAKLEAFLAASPAGAPLYAKHGFNLIETILLDDGKRPESFMMRPAKKT
ncbi:acyl-CoA N-acyltransferase [Daldinia caldariorum]|uniref:acyl-CoA N-acyltransferase n=1 Tax=Daldinia caldariorum TaxID=326644 RepID=UPI002007DDE5|nr:acyl-CoA N-acyltransferase [Daldinia caldariorum]KAI1469619.1 acyl-CoA N-acyltransferase [Daldinia caldariorum]